MKIEDEKEMRDINCVLWALLGLSREAGHLGRALSDFELALEELHEDPWVEVLENRYALNWIKEAYKVILGVYCEIDEYRCIIEETFWKWDFIPTIHSEDLCDESSNWKPERD
jgi:hypothetical protein